MPRCEFNDPAFSEPDVFRGDETDQCWVSEVGKFGTEKNPRYLCIFHAPEGQTPIDHPEWTPTDIGKLQSYRLLQMLKCWNEQNRERDENELLTFVLMGIRCGGITIDNSKFLGPLNLNSANFEGPVNLIRVKFERYVQLKAATFNSIAGFANVTFRWGINFSSVEKDGRDIPTIFNKHAIFTDVNAKRFDLGDSNFRDRATFDNVEIQGTLVTHGAVFENDFQLENSRLKGGASFDRSHFSGDVTFTSNEITGDTSFGKCEFKQSQKGSPNKIKFETSEFKGAIRIWDDPTGVIDPKNTPLLFFDSVKIDGGTDFLSAVFNDISFSRTAFKGGLNVASIAARRISFNSCVLGEPAGFRGCLIHRFVYSSHVGKRLVFIHCHIICDDGGEPGCWYFRDADCSRVSFVNMNGMSQVDFLGANIRDCLFESCEWARDRYFKVCDHDLIMLQILGYPRRDSGQIALLRSLYQQLKVNLEKDHEFATAGVFHFREMDIRRIMAKKEGKRLEHGILWLYRCLGDYGESYKKLFLSILWSILGTASFITLSQEISSGEYTSILLNLQSISIGKLVCGIFWNLKNLPLILIPSPFQKKSVEGYIDCLTHGSKLVVILEGLVLLTLTTLLIMAIRRRFRR